MAETPTSALNSGDTAWMIVATAFVMSMTLPGLALLYDRIAKRKDTLTSMGMHLWYIVSLKTGSISNQ